MIARLAGRIAGHRQRSADRGDRGSTSLRVSSAGSVLILAGSVGYAATYGCGPDASSAGFGEVSNAAYVEQSIAPSVDGNYAVIDSSGENNKFGEEVRIPMDIPSDLLPIYKKAEKAYGIPFEVIAAIGAKETHHGRFLYHDDGSPSGVQEGLTNDWGAAGIVQMGIAGRAMNGWGGAGKSPVEQRAVTYEVGDVPTDDGPWSNGFGIDGNGDGIVNVWDPWDNIISGSFKIAYLAERVAREPEFDNAFSDLTDSDGNPWDASCAGNGITDKLECGVFRHNPATWYLQQVKDIASLYGDDGRWDTAPAVNIQPASLTTNAATGEDCDPGISPVGMPGLPSGAGTHHDAAIAFAREQLGKEYEWGGTGPDKFDCSGLTQKAYEAAGITTPRDTSGQFNPDAPEWSVPVRKFQTDGLVVEELQPGDLVFFHTPGQTNPPGHMGLYIGNDEMIHAGSPVNIAKVSTYGHENTTYEGAVRIYSESTQV